MLSILFLKVLTRLLEGILPLLEVLSCSPPLHELPPRCPVNDLWQISTKYKMTRSLRSYLSLRSSRKEGRGGSCGRVERTSALVEDFEFLDSRAQ